MRNKILFFGFLLVLLASGTVQGEIRVVSSYPYIGDLVKRIGGSRVEGFVLAKATEDPHFIVPKPSFIARMRNADLLVINGADLEIGFLPVLIQQASNPKLAPAGGRLLDLSRYVSLIEIPGRISRAEGDVHPEGNPHFHLDPHNIPLLAKAVQEALCRIDSGSCGEYERNRADFNRRWEEKIREWDWKLSPLKGKKTIEYHALYRYLLARYGLISVGTVEPKPGIPPGARHLEGLREIAQAQGVYFILQDVYHEQKSARLLAEKSAARLVILPHDVGAVPEAGDLFLPFLMKSSEG